ncbi:hypothetical protein H6G33_17600 [Calothrix sp. FACHB-1219]|uniref:hypothetical protein n=1 Tax=unclassified Calothrix TaxID=2619626 RepID=UPI001686DCEC|nr:MULTISPECIES: hypothetical protein [unclassified Calothrix]MBD2202694.1 hypothetical protein [Calothrix sp. FACHB-168]MBD2218847.1 hypothetical protein [Calothrix sp. FACHB-1219]
MGIDRALYLDQASRADALNTLLAIAEQLQSFKSHYPQVFRYLCEAGREGADFTLADASNALAWASNFLEKGK